jgi:hypothetical protein
LIDAFLAYSASSDNAAFARASLRRVRQPFFAAAIETDTCRLGFCLITYFRVRFMTILAPK